MSIFWVLKFFSFCNNRTPSWSYSFHRPIMSDLANICAVLEQSLDPRLAKEAGVQLKSLETTPGFPVSLLHLVSSNDISIPIRLAGSLYFKNLIRRKWIDEAGVYMIDSNDVKLIKSEIIKFMIQLPDQLQIQIGESISLIAESEFPELWPELLDELISMLSLNDLYTNKGILKVAHSIFKRWRPLFRSDELFLEIKTVLDKFCSPFLQMLQGIDSLIDQNLNNKDQLKLLLENMLLLIKIYYDLNCQDIPEFFEDNIQVMMGIVLKYLKFHNSLIEDVSEDDEIDLVIQIKINICELIQLYSTRYGEEFENFIPSFIESVWQLLNEITIQPKFDILTSKALKFLTNITNLSKFNQIFNNNLKELLEKIIIPNVKLREIDEEIFEDDPIEYTRRDLDGSDIDSRRKSCIDLLRALKELNESLVTQEVMVYINQFLNDYKLNGQWKSKDLAIFLFSGIASKGSLTNSGIVNGINLLVDVIEFFSNNIYPDLINDVPHPILKVDAIKYIFTFRNQLTKEQLIQTFPLLSLHFQSDNYVVYTYSAITLEKILSLRNTSQQMMFNKNDIPAEVCNDLLMNLFRLMFKKGETPEKLSENEFLMKCIMRVLLISEDSLGTINEILNQLIKVIEVISKNPSNPKFNHFTFESICVILKFYQRNIVELFEILKPLSFGLLGQNIEEFIPYIFQILSYILENWPAGDRIPMEYEQLIKPLCSPLIWENRGNIPGIERLLSIIIKRKPELFATNIENYLTPVLGVYQKLISSKVNDQLGFDFIETILNYLPLQTLEPFLKQITLVLLTRLQNHKTEKYLKRFVLFLSKMSCLQDKWNSTMVIKLIENVQVGLFDQILNNFIISSISKFNNLTDKKILCVGLTNLVIDNINDIDQNKTLVILKTVIELISSDSIKDYKPIDENVEIMLEIENDEMSFSGSFNKLNIIGTKPWDPIKEIKDKASLISFFKMKITSFSGYQQLASSLDPETQNLLKQLVQ